MEKVDEIYAEISKIIDPEVGFDIVSLGLIYKVEVNDDIAKVTMTLSTKSCPLHELILSWVKQVTMNVKGIKDCNINLVWEPAWNIEMASEEVRDKLSM